MTRWLGGWRAALRVARREARRARGRSALVLAMIMLPVAALAFIAVAQDTFTLTPNEQANRLMGTAQALVAWPHDGPVQQDPAHLDAFGFSDPASETAEPTGALDSQTGEDVMRLLRARCDAGAACLMVTHETRHAAWADRVVFLRDGTMVDSTPPRQGPETLLEKTP